MEEIIPARLRHTPAVRLWADPLYRCRGGSNSGGDALCRFTSALLAGDLAYVMLICNLGRFFSFCPFGLVVSCPFPVFSPHTLSTLPLIHNRSLIENKVFICTSWYGSSTGFGGVRTLHFPFQEYPNF